MVIPDQPLKFSYHCSYFLHLPSCSHCFLAPDPFDIQVRAGCELHSGKTTKGFLNVAFNGLNFLSFQNKLWVPSLEGGIRAQKVCDLLNNDEGIKAIEYYFERDVCPRFLLSLLDAGKMDLQRQGQFSPFFSNYSVHVMPLPVTFFNLNTGKWIRGTGAAGW